ncbi:gluzincin family metallopeptidase [Kribbella swartbergensis]
MSVTTPSAGPPGAQDPPRGPRRWLGLLVAVALVSGGVVYTVEDRERDARARPTTTLTPAGPNQSGKPSKTAAAIAARRVAIDTILIRRAQAVQTVNEALFLQDVDPADKALRAEQKILFANLVEMGFTELGYSQAEERFDPAVVKAHGRTTYLVRILMRYQIPKVDLTPVVTELGYTFINVRGRWVLTDDDDLDDDLGPGAHQEAWDLGRIEVHRGPRVLAVVEKGDTRRGRAIVVEATEALAQVTEYWPRRWRGSVLIIALDESEVRDARFADEDVESAASAGSTFSSLPGQDTADGTVAGAYIVVNPNERDRVDEILLSHEITHVATADLGGYEPLWLAEGAAEYVSWRGIEAISGPGEVAKWEQEVIDEALPALGALPSDAGFYQNNADVYGVSWLAVRYLVRRFGLDKVAELYEDLARHGYDQAARDRILMNHCGLTEVTLWTSLKTYEPQR